MSAYNAVDGFSTGIQRATLRCGLNGREWRIPAGFLPSHEQPLSGVELALDVVSAAMRLGTAAPDALPDRLLMTRSGRAAPVAKISAFKKINRESDSFCLHSTLSATI